MTLATFAIALAGLLAVGGALTVALTRDVMRLVLGLGAFLLGVAGLYLYFGLAYLAVAQVFVYVGGVLVLMLFAVMVVHRREQERPTVTVKHDIGSAAVAVGVSVMIAFSLRGTTDSLVPAPGHTSTGLAAELLGPRVLAFELAGAVLLVALIAVMVIRGSGERP